MNKDDAVVNRNWSIGESDIKMRLEGGGGPCLVGGSSSSPSSLTAGRSGCSVAECELRSRQGRKERRNEGSLRRACPMLPATHT